MARGDVGAGRPSRREVRLPLGYRPAAQLDVLADWAEIYRAAGEEFGTSDKLRIHVLRDAWVADSIDEVERVWWPNVRSEHWFYFEQVPRWVADREPFLEDISSEEDFQFDRHRRIG